MIGKQPLVSSFSTRFKKEVLVTEDPNEAKLEHRSNLRKLVDKYMQDVESNKAEGIRNAKELVEVIKADMLLMGENTENIGANTVDEIRVQRLEESLDLNNPEVQALVSNIFNSYNDINDSYSTARGINEEKEKQDSKEEKEENSTKGSNEESTTTGDDTTNDNSVVATQDKLSNDVTDDTE